MRRLILSLLFAAFGTLAIPAEAVKHCACRPRGLPTFEVPQ